MKLFSQLRLFFFLLAVALLGACDKDDDAASPDIKWSLEYNVTSIGQVNVKSITYRDQNGTRQTIAGQREFRLTFEADSGFLAELEVDGEATNGGIIGRINATALDGTFRNIGQSDDDGQSSGTTKNIRLLVRLLMP